MPSAGKVIGYTLLGAVAGAATVATCGAAAVGITTTCAGWSAASATMPIVVGTGATGGAGIGGGIGYAAATNKDKNN